MTLLQSMMLIPLAVRSHGGSSGGAGRRPFVVQRLLVHAERPEPKHDFLPARRKGEARLMFSKIQLTTLSQTDREGAGQDQVPHPNTRPISK